ncbi:hypothetical protein SELMODRAFT_402024 [Selaginella moellendorffii]|uniref:Uncharacterized protein n=1 Tax=Selaginella moellendorffii TaxID=88036 RepID=D8QPC5_SELML|nr:hypothetical protein SELMODRAFT_402024 [Selaginella moellendorffii]
MASKDLPQKKEAAGMSSDAPGAANATASPSATQTAVKLPVLASSAAMAAQRSSGPSSIRMFRERSPAEASGVLVSWFAASAAAEDCATASFAVGAPANTAHVAGVARTRSPAHRPDSGVVCGALLVAQHAIPLASIVARAYWHSGSSPSSLSDASLACRRSFEY